MTQDAQQEVVDKLEHPLTDEKRLGSGLKPSRHSREGGNPYSSEGRYSHHIAKLVVMDSRLRGNDVIYKLEYKTPLCIFSFLLLSYATFFSILKNDSDAF